MRHPADMQSWGIGHVLLDRDGVVNCEPASGYITQVEQWRWEEGSLEALAMLHSAGMRVSIVTNQSCVGKGLSRAEEISALHHWVASQTSCPLTFYVCMHAPADGCSCRKPLPGMVREAVSDSHIPAERTIFFGDAERDLLAGIAAGVHVALVRTGKGEHTARAFAGRDIPVFARLLEGVEFLLGERGHSMSNQGEQ